MTIIRRIGLFVSALLLCVCLAIFAFSAGLYDVFNTPQQLKSALQSSGIYEEITPSLLAEQTTISGLPLKDIGVQTALAQALPATFYQQSSEQILNGTYNWMHGHTAAPEFSIDLTTVKSDFADNIATYVRQQLDALPPCKSPTPPPESAGDALSVTCLSPSVTPANIASTARQQVLESELLFKGNTVTATTLTDGQGRTFTQQLAFLPELYRFYVPALVILPIVIVALALAITYWSAVRKIGLRRVAWIFLSIGLLGVVLAAVGIELFHMGVRLFGLPVSASLELQDKLVKTIETLAVSARSWWLGICTGYVAVGVVLFIILRVQRPKQTLKFSNKNEP